jgi:glutamate synthase (NADPH) large chain
MAFVYDPEDVFALKVNPETVVWQRIDHPHWDAALKAMVAEHVAETKSPLGARLLNDWDREVERFWQVVPKEMLQHLPVPLSVAEEKRA